jgi:hypothetical protein
MLARRTLGLRQALFCLAVVLLLTPVFVFHYFPSVDGPAHVLNASLLNRLLFHPDAQLQAWYRWNPVVVPNWLDHLLLMALLPFLSGPLAERVVIAVYAVTFVFAFRYALRGVARDTQGLEFLALPLVFNMHVYWGFYNFCLSLAVFLVILGFLLRTDGDWTMLRTGILAALALVLYISHGLMFLFGLMTALLYSVLRHRFNPRAAVGSAVHVSGAFLPGLALFLYYYFFRVLRAETVTEWPSLRYATSLVVTLSPMVAFSRTERFLSALYALMLYGLVALRLWQLRSRWDRPELLLIGLAGVASVFVLPVTASGGTMTTPRLVYFPVFLLVMWLAAVPMPSGWTLVAATMSFMIAGGLQLARWPAYRAYDREIGQLQASLKKQVRPGGLYLEYPGDTLGPFTTGGRISQPDVSPSALCYLGVSTKAFILSNYEGDMDHFPLLFRSNRNPYRHLFQKDGEPLAGALDRQWDTVRIDGVLSWCNQLDKGVCETNPLGDSYSATPLSNGPPEARFFVYSHGMRR